MSRSVVRSVLAVLSVAVFACIAIAVLWVITTPSQTDGALSPSQLAAKRYNAKKTPREWVAGTVVTCHAAASGILTYAIRDEHGSAPDIAFIRYTDDGRPAYAVGERVAFSGWRVGPVVIEATDDLLRPPL